MVAVDVDVAEAMVVLVAVATDCNNCRGREREGVVRMSLSQIFCNTFVQVCIYKGRMLT